MFEDCSSLSELEDRISLEIEKVSLLGEISLSGQDVDPMVRLTRSRFQDNMSRAIVDLDQSAPCVLACLLVQLGIRGYREGDYWTAVENAFEISLSANQQAKLGKRFLKFLDERGLYCCEIPNAPRYVTPILLHGGIPNTCLTEYFEKVCCPLVEKDLLDPSNYEDVSAWLNRLRKREHRRAQMTRRLTKLREDVRELASCIQYLEPILANYGGLAQLIEARKKKTTIEIPPTIPDRLVNFLENRKRMLGSLRQELQHLREDMSSQMKAFDIVTQRDRLILARRDEVDAVLVKIEMVEEECKAAHKLEHRMKTIDDRLKTVSGKVSPSVWGEKNLEFLRQIDIEALSREISAFSDQSEHIAALEKKVSQKEEALEQKGYRKKSLLAMLTTLLGSLSGAVSLMQKSWWWTASSLLLAALSGTGARHWQQQEKEKSSRLESLRETLVEAHRGREEARKAIQDIVSPLSIKEELLQEPSHALCKRLEALQKICKERLSVQKDSARLSEQITKQRGEIQAFLQELDLGQTDDPRETIQESLAQAVAHRKEAVLATERSLELLKALLDQIRTGQKVTRELDRVYRQLVSVGDGNAKVGLERIHFAEANANKIDSLQRKLRSTLTDLPGAERELRRRMARGEARDDLESEIADLRDRLGAKRREISHAEEKMERWPEAYPQVDEPIRRYLLYGGVPAERFLAASTNLLCRALTDADQEKVREQLPSRVIDAFDIWWETQSPGLFDKTTEEGSRGERLQKPQVEVDPVYGEVYITCPKQILGKTTVGNTVEFVITGVNKVQNLPLYTRGRDLVETEEREIALPSIAEELKVSLQSAKQLLEEWMIRLWHPSACCVVFDADSLHLIEEKELPRTTLWLLLPKDIKVSEPDTLAQEPLYDAWYGHRLVKVDVGKDDELILIDEKGKSTQIPLETETPQQIKLLGADRIEGVDSDGADVYNGLPQLRVPVDSGRDLSEWLLTVVYEKDHEKSIRYRPLHDLQTALEGDPEQGWIDVDLRDEAVLGPRVFGSVTLRLQKELYHRVLLDTRICIVPGLDFDFSKRIYPPYAEEAPRRVRVRLVGAEEFDFIAESPAEAQKEGSEYRIVTYSNVDSIKGAVQSGDDGKLSVPLNIKIPKLRWRLRGLSEEIWKDWQDKIDEVWLGDWEDCEQLRLDVRVPSVLDGSISLVIGDESTEQQKLQAGKGSFDLLSRQQVLRNWPALKPFRLRFLPETDEEKEFLLFRGRTHWQVHDVQVTQKYKADRIVLDVTWQESGRTGNRSRIVRLWRCDAPQQEPVVQKGVEKRRASFLLDRVEFDVNYRLQFTLQDPWEKSVVTFPDQDEPNVIGFTLCPESEIGEVIVLEQALDQREWGHPLPDEAYCIKILGHIADLRVPENVQTQSVTVTTGNEGWFVGELYATNADLRNELNREFKRINPVKVQPLESSYRGAIEDREGEGTMYCMKCKRLYWNEDNHLQCREQGYSPVGPIERFKIRRLQSAQEGM